MRKVVDFRSERSTATMALEWRPTSYGKRPVVDDNWAFDGHGATVPSKRGRVEFEIDPPSTPDHWLSRFVRAAIRAGVEEPLRHLIMAGAAIYLALRGEEITEEGIEAFLREALPRFGQGHPKATVSPYTGTLWLEG